MKNVLLTTTALVVLAGVASAEISWSAKTDIGYNDKINGGLFYDASVDLKGEFDLGDGYGANITYGADLESNAGATTPWSGGPVIKRDAFPTIEITSPYGSLKGGDLADKGASEYFYKDRSGMSLDVENHDSSTRFDYRALAEFGDYGIAFGGEGDNAGGLDGMSVGAGATFGNFTIGLGYDQKDTTHTGNNIGASVDTTFGAASIGLSYLGSGSDRSIGVAVGYDISSDLSAKAYYANNKVPTKVDAYGVSVAYKTGALGLDLYYDHTDANVNKYGVDVSYEVMSELTAYVGYQSAATNGYYVGAKYTINDNLSATVSYSDGNEISGPEFKDGVSVFLTASF